MRFFNSRHYSLFIMLSAILFVSCKKELAPGHPAQLQSVDKPGRGHLQQANTYSAEPILKWMDMNLQLVRTNATPLGGLVPGRMFGYCGVAAYEAAVPGMPAFQTLSGQLTDMPNMPPTQPGLAYHWPISVNAALASMNRQFFPATSAANKFSMDSLESALNDVYKTEVDEEVFNRSVQFGKDVATAIFNWSKTDGASHANDPYALPTEPGSWVPTPPAFAAPAAPYWGNNRLMVQGSLDGAAPPPSIPYSTDPSSDFYKMVKEVYDISQTLTPEQIAIGLYFRDNPGYGGAHYLSILKQILIQDNSRLDKAAFAYAKVGVAIVDAGIGCWAAKYTYNVERPITYIQTVFNKPEWTPLFATPNFPEYPSGHSTVGGAFVEAMTEIFGENYHFTNHTYDYLGMAPRSYNSFYDLSEEIGKSRVYAGIHYTVACVQGKIQGIKVAKNINEKLDFIKE